MNINTSAVYKRFSRVLAICAVIFPVLAVLCAVFFFFAMRKDFDPGVGHFAFSSVPFILTVSVILLSAVLSISCYFLARRSASLYQNPDTNLPTIFGSVLAAMMSVLCLVNSAADLSLGLLSKPALFAAILLPFLGISMILSIIKNLRVSPLRQFCAILAVLAVNISMFADYFNFSLPLNSPVRNLVTVMKAASLLYLLSEARLSFGIKSSRVSPAFTVCASGLAASITLGYSLGAILVTLIPGVTSNPSPSLNELGLYAAIGVHAAGRLFTFIPAIGPYVQSSEADTSPEVLEAAETAKITVTSENTESPEE